MQSKKQANQSLAGLALIAEFLGILATTPLLGTGVDIFIMGRTGPGLFALLGLAAGFLYGLMHLVRRAKSLAADLDSPAVPRVLHNREGYESDVGGRIEKIQAGLKDVGQRIDHAIGEDERAP